MNHFRRERRGTRCSGEANSIISLRLERADQQKLASGESGQGDAGYEPRQDDRISSFAKTRTGRCDVTSRTTPSTDEAWQAGNSSGLRTRHQGFCSSQRRGIWKSLALGHCSEAPLIAMRSSAYHHALAHPGRLNKRTRRGSFLRKLLSIAARGLRSFFSPKYHLPLRLS